MQTAKKSSFFFFCFFVFFKKIKKVHKISVSSFGISSGTQYRVHQPPLSPITSNTLIWSTQLTFLLLISTATFMPVLSFHHSTYRFLFTSYYRCRGQPCWLLLLSHLSILYRRRVQTIHFTPQLIVMCNVGTRHLVKTGTDGCVIFQIFRSDPSFEPQDGRIQLLCWYN